MAKTTQVLTFENGLQELDGTVSPDYGSTSGKVAQGDDPRFRVENVVVVEKDPGAGEFSSIKSARDSILDADPATNPYVIEVGPGVYTEDTIDLIPGITLKARGHGSVIIKPSDPDNDIIHISGSGPRLQGCTLRDATGVNAAAIRFTDTPSPGILDFITIQNCTEGIVVESASSVTQAVLRQVRIIAGSTTKTLLRVTATGGFSTITRVYSAILTDDDGTAFECGIRIEGPGSRIDANNILLRSTTGVGTGFHLRDGAEFASQTGSEAEGFNKNLWAENVGDPPLIRTTTIMLRAGVTSDIDIEHPGTTGSMMAKADIDNKVFVDMDAPIKLFITDPYPGHPTGIFVRGDILQADRFDRKANLSKIAREATTLGVVSGGDLSLDSGRSVAFTAGSGFLLDPVDFFVKEIFWDAGTIEITANTRKYIFVDTNGDVQLSASEPNLETTILLGSASASASALDYIVHDKMDMTHAGNRTEVFQREALQAISASGGNVTEVNTRELAVGTHVYYYGTNRFAVPSASSPTIVQTYRDGLGDFVRTDITQIPNNIFDDSSGTPASVTTSYYTAHELYQVKDVSSTVFFLVLSQTQYSDQVLAEGASLNTRPFFISGAVVPLAKIIMQEGVDSIISIIPIKPTPQFVATGVSASADHNQLLNLDVGDFHPQYLPVGGSRGMEAPLDMGGFAITDVGNVDGVDVSAHASRHLPNGADPITTAQASEITDSTNSEGNANSLARSNHGHAHGNRGGGSLHAAATTSVAGFLSSTDKTKLDGVASGATNTPLGSATPQPIGTATTGVSSNASHEDHVHAHGSQTDPAHHAVATTSVAGFMSASDKTKLDGISGTRVIKSGIITAASFAGNPKKATVTFSTAFSSTNYSFVVMGGNGRTWSYESKLAASIVVNSNANAAPSNDVMWIAIDNGESIE